MIADTQRPRIETLRWVEGWQAQSAALIDLLGDVEGGTPATATALLSWVRECRRSLVDPPDPRLRSLCQHALEEVWEAACSLLYGDVGPADGHADAALRHVREMRRICDALG